ncbi:WYL domain-containing transcriptional regulator [Nannocystis sp. SCPEA4]|uniref:helix-turn-helix transcriptional regulator n=1 Tax=Nannocystis sp. SCPEA4 TaxID=2996787 RepID=UPI00226D7E62|nr:WYL domain-containing transcriptional regulator [Nannocystis sp. SCPEA4]MCY1059332.1 WYL domain-containing transcriptional regulator [Nannocystis sp. SCPEA4]
MARGEQLVRQWSILDLLSEGRKSRRALAEQLGVSLKTITRDIEALSLFPIAEEREGIDVFYQLMHGTAPRIRFEPEEVAALLLSKRTVLGALAGSPYAAAVATALAKVEVLQRDRTDRELRRLPEVFQSSFDLPRIRTELQERLLEAGIERRRVWIRYFTAERGAHSERVVEPFFLRLHPHGLDLIAYCLERRDFLSFNVNRIEALRVRDDTFDPTARAFDLDRFLVTTFDGRRGNPVLDVCIRVKQPTAAWARDHFYHATQELRELGDGVEIRFRSGAPEAIAARILSLGPDCEVVEPDSLARLVAHKAEAIAARYRHRASGSDPGPDLSGVGAKSRREEGGAT